MVIAGQQVLTKTFSNGVRVFSRETTKKGAKVIRTTAFDKSGRLICDRYKTLASENIMGGKLNTITKHYFGEHALGEAYTKGKYNVTGRIYDTKGLREIVDLHTTPTYLEKYGSCPEPVPKHLYQTTYRYPSQKSNEKQLHATHFCLVLAPYFAPRT